MLLDIASDPGHIDRLPRWNTVVKLGRITEQECCERNLSFGHPEHLEQGWIRPTGIANTFRPAGSQTERGRRQLNVRDGIGCSW